MDAREIKARKVANRVLQLFGLKCAAHYRKHGPTPERPAGDRGMTGVRLLYMHQAFEIWSIETGVTENHEGVLHALVYSAYYYGLGGGVYLDYLLAPPPEYLAGDEWRPTGRTVEQLKEV